jgi:hypothetical protein
MGFCFSIIVCICGYYPVSSLLSQEDAEIRKNTSTEVGRAQTLTYYKLPEYLTLIDNDEPCLYTENLCFFFGNEDGRTPKS